MTEAEKAQRIAAWGWCAMTLGVEVTSDRVRGLVGATELIPLERLRPALQAAMQSMDPESSGLPRPGAVVAAAKAIGAAKARKLEHSGRELTTEEHRRVLAELNPEGWSPEKIGAYLARRNLDPVFLAESEAATAARVLWADANEAIEIGRRQVTAGYRIGLRRKLWAEAFDVHPRPDPLADGWTAPEPDPVSALMGKMRGASSFKKRVKIALSSAVRTVDDAKGIAAAKQAARERG